MMGRVFSRFTLGFAVGYVLGTKAGRQRYEQIRRWWSSFTGSPTVQQSIREVMTPDPQTVKASSPVAEAARKMRHSDVGAMVVVDESNRVTGILTDRDLTIRAIAEGKDATTTKVSEVASQDLTTLSPTDSVEQAVRLMRERAVRRLPVVEAGRAVGIVSIGDLAMERDPRSALADISERGPNR